MMEDFLQLIRTRRSIRRYQDRALPEDLVERLLQAVATQIKSKTLLAEAMGQRLRKDLTADGRSPDIIEADVQRSFQRISNAPVVILVNLSMQDMDSYPDRQRQENEWIMAVQSTAMAGQNILLAAHALGLGACWMCAPLFCPNVVRRALGLPNDWQPQGLITIGFPAEAMSKTRQPLSEVVSFHD
jgi:coenzyme F420-0:L-glutamate ligase/coenzyme F420-1:gamma-L-glutamate ligase